MCRFMGVASDAPATIRELLDDELAPFLALACEHEHGWGVAYRSPNGVVRRVRGTDRADHSNALQTLLSGTITTAVAIHIRMASTGMRVALNNTHPFGDDSVAFIHNGEFHPRECLDSLIGPDLMTGAEGDTDSERYYLAVRTQLDQGVAPAKAIAQSADAVTLRADSYIALNCALLTSTGLFAYSQYEPDSEVMRRRGEGFFSLRVRELQGRTMFASQGWPQPSPQWWELPEGSVLEVLAGSEGHGGQCVITHPLR